jgi:hypothetical protein
MHVSWPLGVGVVRAISKGKPSVRHIDQRSLVILAILLLRKAPALGSIIPVARRQFRGCHHLCRAGAEPFDRLLIKHCPGTAAAPRQFYDPASDDLCGRVRMASKPKGSAGILECCGHYIDFFGVEYFVAQEWRNRHDALLKAVQAGARSRLSATDAWQCRCR